MISQKDARACSALRQELWGKVAVAVARAEGATDNTAPGVWADQVLADFDARWPGIKAAAELARFDSAPGDYPPPPPRED